MIVILTFRFYSSNRLQNKKKELLNSFFYNLLNKCYWIVLNWLSWSSADCIDRQSIVLYCIVGLVFKEIVDFIHLSEFCSVDWPVAQEDKAPLNARYRSEVAHALNRRCYPHPGNDGLNQCLNSILSLAVGFSIEDKATSNSLLCGRYLLAPFTEN